VQKLSKNVMGKFISY